MYVGMDGWLEEFKCIGHNFQFFFKKLGLVVSFMRGSRRYVMGLDGARE